MDKEQARLGARRVPLHDGAMPARVRATGNKSFLAWLVALALASALWLSAPTLMACLYKLPSPHHVTMYSKPRLEAHIMSVLQLHTIRDADTLKRSKCPDARGCLRDLIVPAMHEVADQVDFSISYIGRYEACLSTLGFASVC